MEVPRTHGPLQGPKDRGRIVVGAVEVERLTVPTELDPTLRNTGRGAALPPPRSGHPPEPGRVDRGTTEWIAEHHDDVCGSGCWSTSNPDTSACMSETESKPLPHSVGRRCCQQNW